MTTFILINILFLAGAVYCVYTGQTVKDKTTVRGWYIGAVLLVGILALHDVMMF